MMIRLVSIIVVFQNVTLVSCENEEEWAVGATGDRVNIAAAGRNE